jgi:hypothetical protein
MKLLLHYVKNDWLRWRELMLALWALLGLHGVMVWLGNEALKTAWVEEHWIIKVPASWQMAAFVCRVLIVLCAAVLCFAAGGVDSQARDNTWQRTRPGRGWMLALAHWLSVMLGVVLPVTLSYTLALWLLRFDGPTIMFETLQMLVCASATVTMLMLWAAALPSFSGLVLGVGAGVLAVVGLTLGGASLPGQWTRGTPHPTAVVLVLMLPALCAWRRMPSAPQRLRAGLLAGGMLVAVIYLMPLASRLTQWPGPDGVLGRRAFGDSDEEWKLRAAAPLLWETSSSWQSQDLWFRRVEGDLLDKGIELTGSKMEAVSWRADSGAAWSDWQPCEGSLEEGNSRGNWTLKLYTAPGALGHMEDGELRVRSRLLLAAESGSELPPETGALARGEGWNLEVMHQQQEQWPYLLQTVSRTALFSRQGRLRVYGALRHSMNAASVSIWSGARDFIRTSWQIYDVTPQTTGEAGPQHLSLSYQSSEETCAKVIHVSGVWFTPPRRSQPLDEEESPSPGWTTARSRVVFPRTTQSLEPWPKQERLLVTDMEASSAEVSSLLHRITAGEYPADAKRLPLLVPGHLALFLEMEKRKPNDRVRDAILAGATEEQRGAILEALTDAPALVELVVRRGWAAEAKPYVLQIVERLGIIPYNLLPLCRSYRDPAFNDMMRKSWRADLATVTYWESMPELASELPQRLAVEKDKLLQQIPSYNAQPASVLLRNGDREVLDFLLRNRLRSRIEGVRLLSDLSKNDAALRRFVRDENGHLLPEPAEELISALGETAEDYHWDAARHCFIRKKRTP